MTNSEKRSLAFTRNQDLEAHLNEVNSLLVPGNQALLADFKRSGSVEQFSKIFIVGPLRSGTTLFTQWLSASGLVGYPSNILSRFYGAPLVGAKIQQLLADPKYNFRDEILDFNSKVGFTSENGKTQGALAPNEFWYFWRRFLPFKELDYLPDEALLKHEPLNSLRDELNALASIFAKPFALKAMIMNQNVPVLDSLFQKAIFVWVRRKPAFNIQSVLEARRRQFGRVEEWYSFKIKEYPYLKDLPPLQSAAGQVAAINKSLESAFSRLDESKQLLVEYEDFCQQPEYFYNLLCEKLEAQSGAAALPDYSGPNIFSHNDRWRTQDYSIDEVSDAYLRAMAQLDQLG